MLVPRLKSDPLALYQEAQLNLDPFSTELSRIACGTPYLSIKKKKKKNNPEIALSAH
jgi:hypothetical protein